MYSGHALEDNCAVRKDLVKAQYVGTARRASLGALLRIGPEPLSLFWSNPSRGLHAAGLGVCGEVLGDVTWLPGSAPSSPPPGPWFGGWAFDAARPWSGFASERWVLPEVLAWWDGAHAWLAAFGQVGASAEALSARLDRVTELEPRVDLTAQVTRTTNLESRTHWDALVTEALSELDRGTSTKLVCARTISVKSDVPFVERSILKALEARHPQCWTFLVRGEDGRAFIGASPETLLETHGDSLQVDALAGTAASGQGAQLLSDDKERREHAAVVTGIETTLRPFIASVSVPASPTVKALSNVEHLHTSITGQLKAGVRALDVARALHPTPAVAGTPTEAALGWLREHEGFERGWYCGAVGAMGPAGVTLAVGLRSALLSRDEATLFVGAGVVKGSTPEREWVETERKAAALLPALGVSHG